ncbi:MAG TPA: thioredoxin fold domain-containing protein [Nitrospirota bacterium]|nr:thioredoxin fold domain-containing protein [Nitrospirota bacterium]
MTAERSINWLDDIGEAKKAAAGSGKPVLLFFHYTHCTGCINTFQKTLTKMSVIDKISEDFVPVLIETSERPKDVELYNVLWTPTFIVADETGMETDRWEGYLPEDDYLGHLEFAHARVALKKEHYKDAERLLSGIVLKYPLSEFAPQASYYLGVARYRETKDPSQLTKAYEDLRSAYPGSVWSIKASVWSRDNIEGVRRAA